MVLFNDEVTGKAYTTIPHFEWVCVSFD